MIKAKVVGAGGYGGVGIIELLLKHPRARIARLVDVEHAGNPISAIYPHLRGFCDMTITAPDAPEAEPPDVVFMATPDGVGMSLAPAVLEAGAKVIDYSGDFRFNTARAYAEYARRIGRDQRHASPDLLPEAVYGLAELHRDEITPAARLVGNPGCFAVSCILGLAPALKHGVILPDGMICDCKTGVSGAGRKPKANFHYPAMQDNMSAYRLAGHQHVCEIERELGLVGGRDLRVTFTAQVVPVCRGIMSTLYGRLSGSVAAADVAALYRVFYAGSPFVRVWDADAALGTSFVRGTNYCNLAVSVDARCDMLRVVSYIDNLVKGQAGSALQNMNLLFGLPETTGLDRPGQYP
ncbi:MAG: N-acetyl-gamma-glutamyl-phosphate reductase [Lentisphaerae bacterium]|nr:N-acetyl-gamma-glutamyl-phosphate reductase [Lentisphaerota bacterium]